MQVYIWIDLLASAAAAAWNTLGTVEKTYRIFIRHVSSIFPTNVLGLTDSARVVGI